MPTHDEMEGGPLSSAGCCALPLLGLFSGLPPEGIQSMASAKQPYESMWVAVVQLWPADMAKRLLWLSLADTADGDSGVQGHPTGAVLGRLNAMAEFPKVGRAELTVSRLQKKKKKKPPGSWRSRPPASAKRTG